MVIADTDNGTKFDNTIARPDTELTAAWLGIKKKKTAAAIIRVAPVITNSSFTAFIYYLLSCFCL